MRFASLGSGSKGNSLIVQPNSNTEKYILVDCGFSTTEVINRLARLSVSIDQIIGICATHEHDDHIRGIETLAKRQQIPIYLTYGTFLSHRWRRADLLNFCFIKNYQAFELLNTTIEPYPVPHDAHEPAQFVFSNELGRLGILTDAGHVTPHMIKMLSSCDGLVIECNHDSELLKLSNYPSSLKQRVGGIYGHLNNTAANSLLKQICKKRLKHVIGAHLSQQNNTPNLAYHAIATGVDHTYTNIRIACQENGFDWISLVDN